MISVPRRDQGVVPTVALPGVRVNTGVPSGAFQPPTPVDVSGVQRVVSQLADKERAKADQLAVLDADNKLAELQTNLMTQVTQLKGKDALGAEAHATDQWKKGVDEIRNGLTNDRQQLSFETRASGRYQSLYESVARHAEGETQRYDDETTTSALDNRLNQAVSNYKDSAQLAQATTETRAILTDYARRNGKPKEWLQSKLSDRLSKVHTAVIDRMLANGDDLSASNYYATAKPEIAGTDSIQVEHALEEGSVRGESQRQADTIIASAATMSGALAQARAIADPKVRDATREQVIHYYEDQATSQRLEREQTFQRAGQILEKTADVRSIPPADWLKLSVEERDHLQYREDQMRRPKRVTNPDTYYSLLNMSGLSDASRKQFESLDLMKFRPQLSDADFEDLAKLQRTSRLRTEGGVASEARRQSTAAQKVADKAAARAAAVEQLRSLGLNIPDAPVPGAPLRPQATSPSVGSPTRNAPAGSTRSSSQQKVPQAWLDRAAHDPNYKIYLQHMGIDVP